jgi:transposase
MAPFKVTEETETLTSSQAAQALNVSKSTLLRWLKENRQLEPGRELTLRGGPNSLNKT